MLSDQHVPGCRQFQGAFLQPRPTSVCLLCDCPLASQATGKGSNGHFPSFLCSHKPSQEMEPRHRPCPQGFFFPGWCPETHPRSQVPRGRRRRRAGHLPEAPVMIESGKPAASSGRWRLSKDLGVGAVCAPALRAVGRGNRFPSQAEPPSGPGPLLLSAFSPQPAPTLLSGLTFSGRSQDCRAGLPIRPSGAAEQGEWSPPLRWLLGLWRGGAVSADRDPEQPQQGAQGHFPINPSASPGNGPFAPRLLLPALISSPGPPVARPPLSSGGSARFLNSLL